MKKYIVLLAAIFLTSGSAFSIENATKTNSANDELKMLHSATPMDFRYPDSKTQSEVDENSIDYRRQYIEGGSSQRADNHTPPPVKRLRLKIKKYRYDKELKAKGLYVEPTKTEVPIGPKDQLYLDCDNTEYFNDRREIEATGHVVVYTPDKSTLLKADKMIYSSGANTIRAFDNVTLIKDGNEIYGDYMVVNMNEENVFMDHPRREDSELVMNAQKGYMFDDKIVQENGKTTVKNHKILQFFSSMVGPRYEQLYIPVDQQSSIKDFSDVKTFTIKAKNVILKSTADHDTMTMKKAQIYYGDKKICTMPSFTVHTNKAQDYFEANYPEMGSRAEMGMYAGPGFVFDTPGGTTLKLAPMVNYKDKIGFGGAAKFKSASNMTDVIYGSANDSLYVLGKQKLDDDLFFQYSSMAYLDNWFMGGDLPKYAAELVYQHEDSQHDFLGKGRDLVFTNRLGLGYMQDRGEGAREEQAQISSEGGVGTFRAQYMSELRQTLYRFGKEEDLKFGWFQLVGQGAATVYGTGDTQFLARIGPNLHTQYKMWMSDIGYMFSGYSDGTPMQYYDSYRYGRSNVYWRETLRVHKYLALSWFASLNLEKDGGTKYAEDEDMMRECTFYASLGPDDLKVHLGYDVVRQQTFFVISMLMDAKGSSIEYDRLEVKNYDKLGQKKEDDTLFKETPKEDGKPVPLEKAEVVNLDEVL